MEKFKGLFVKGVVLLVNAMLVVGGVFFIKQQTDKKNEVADTSTEEATAPTDQVQETATPQEQVPQAVDYTAVQKAIIEDQKKKLEQISSNPSSKTVQQPKTVTQTIPAKTTTVKVPSTSSTSTKSSSTTTTTSKPKTTTKKS